MRWLPTRLLHKCEKIRMISTHYIVLTWRYTLIFGTSKIITNIYRSDTPGAWICFYCFTRQATVTTVILKWQPWKFHFGFEFLSRRHCILWMCEQLVPWERFFPSRNNEDETWLTVLLLHASRSFQWDPSKLVSGFYTFYLYPNHLFSYIYIERDIHTLTNASENKFLFRSLNRRKDFIIVCAIYFTDVLLFVCSFVSLFILAKNWFWGKSLKFIFLFQVYTWFFM